MEGLREKIPVQRRIPLQREQPDPALGRFYAELLACVRDPLFREGEMELLGVQEGVILFLRRLGGRVALVGGSAGYDDRAESPALSLPLARLAAAGGEGLGRDGEPPGPREQPLGLDTIASTQRRVEATKDDLAGDRPPRRLLGWPEQRLAERVAVGQPEQRQPHPRQGSHIVNCTP